MPAVGCHHPGLLFQVKAQDKHRTCCFGEWPLPLHTQWKYISIYLAELFCHLIPLIFKYTCSASSSLQGKQRDPEMAQIIPPAPNPGGHHYRQSPQLWSPLRFRLLSIMRQMVRETVLEYQPYISFASDTNRAPTSSWNQYLDEKQLATSEPRQGWGDADWKREVIWRICLSAEEAILIYAFMNFNLYYSSLFYLGKKPHSITKFQLV